MYDFSRLKMSLEALLAHKLRLFLTLLGLSLGIASVIIVLALSKSAEKTLKNFYRLKENYYIIEPVRNLNIIYRMPVIRRPEINYETYEHIKKNCPYAIKVIPVKYTRFQFKFCSYIKRESVIGTTDEIERYKPLVSGNFLTREDILAGNYVCVMFEPGLSHNPLSRYIGYYNEYIGKEVQMDNQKVTLKGVLKQGAIEDFTANDVIMPITTVMKMEGSKGIDRIEVKMKPLPEKTAIEKLRNIIKEDYPYEYNKYNIYSALDKVKEISKNVSFSTLILFISSLITIIVSGTGVINILMVSLQDRIMEIGIRRAVGASKKEILLQFLIESIMLCISGGFIGTGIAFIITEKIIKLTNDFGLYNIKLSSSLDWFEIFLFATGFSCLIGIIFGVYPARQASELNVIECLRHGDGNG